MLIFLKKNIEKGINYNILYTSIRKTNIHNRIFISLSQVDNVFYEFWIWKGIALLSFSAANSFYVIITIMCISHEKKTSLSAAFSCV